MLLQSLLENNKTVIIASANPDGVVGASLLSYFSKHKTVFVSSVNEGINRLDKLNDVEIPAIIVEVPIGNISSMRKKTNTNVLIDNHGVSVALSHSSPFDDGRLLAEKAHSTSEIILKYLTAFNFSIPDVLRKTVDDINSYNHAKMEEYRKLGAFVSLWGAENASMQLLRYYNGNGDIIEAQQTPLFSSETNGSQNRVLAPLAPYEGTEVLLHAENILKSCVEQSEKGFHATFGKNSFSVIKAKSFWDRAYTKEIVYQEMHKRKSNCVLTVKDSGDMFVISVKNSGLAKIVVESMGRAVSKTTGSMDYQQTHLSTRYYKKDFFNEIFNKISTSENTIAEVLLPSS